jgi:hypothetical protein
LHRKRCVRFNSLFWELVYGNWTYLIVLKGLERKKEERKKESIVFCFNAINERGTHLLFVTNTLKAFELKS